MSHKRLFFLSDACESSTTPQSDHLPVAHLMFKGPGLHSTERKPLVLNVSRATAVYKALLPYQILSTYFSKDNIRETRFFKKQRSFARPNSPCVCWIYLKEKNTPFNCRICCESRGEERNASRLWVKRSCTSTRYQSAENVQGLALRWGVERESRQTRNRTLFSEFLLRTYLFVISFVQRIPSGKLKNKRDVRKPRQTRGHRQPTTGTVGKQNSVGLCMFLLSYQNYKTIH